MFYSRISDDMINKVHERAMRVILIDHESGFETLLQNNMTFVTVTETFKHS